MVITTRENEQRIREADLLYERYGKPLEKDHRGQFVAITADGRTLIGTTLLAVAQEAERTLETECFLFKLGERVVGRWR